MEDSFDTLAPPAKAFQRRSGTDAVVAIRYQNSND